MRLIRGFLRTCRQFLADATSTFIPHMVFRRRLSRDLGRAQVYFSRTAAFGLFRPNLERFNPRLFNLVRKTVTAGDIVWDVGANVGLFAFSAAHLAGRDGYVAAIEADPRMAALLLRSAAKKRSEAAQVDILCAAVADQVGLGDMCLAIEDAANNHLSNAANKADFNQVCRVVTVTLDWLLTHFPAPTVLKADIEGAESAMLKGAIQLLSEVRPRMLIEVKPANVNIVTEILKSHDYLMFNGELENMPQQSVCAYETLAIPREWADGCGPLSEQHRRGSDG